MPKKRILIIEDRRDDANLLSRLLESRELETSCVGTMAEALECLRVQRFDLVLCDVNLPDSSGIETIAATPKFGDMPIIMVTGSEDRDIVFACSQAGLGLEFKPIHVPSLMAKIFLRLARHNPSPEMANAIVEEHHRAQESEKEPTPWILRWQPVLALALALLVASFTSGAFLWDKLGARGAQAQENIAHFQAVDSALKVHEGQLKSASLALEALASAAQSSKEDRVVLHQNLDALAKATDKASAELKKDIVDRLNRIEDKLDRRP